MRMLRFVDLEDAADKMPNELSGGMRRRVGIARALAGSPKIILYDEPTAGLDPITARTINELALKLRDLEEVSSIFVTHRLKDLQVLSSEYVVRDDQGNLVTEDGFQVQSDGGAITLQPQDGDLQVAADGTVSTRLQLLGKLRVVSFANERTLKKVGGGLYDAGGQTAQASTTARVHQGLVERSNVEPVIEIAHMIEVLRAYQMSSDLTKSGEDLLKQAIEKLGAVPTA